MFYVTLFFSIFFFFWVSLPYLKSSKLLVQIAAVIQIEEIEKNSLDPETGEVIPLPPEVCSQALYQILDKVPRSHGQTSAKDNPAIVALREELAEERHRHDQT